MTVGHEIDHVSIGRHSDSRDSIFYVCCQQPKNWNNEI